MNETINLSQLIVRLGEVTGADSNTSRRFLREFFACLAEGLASEGDGASVTIPGIGSFVRYAGADGTSAPTVLFRPDEVVAGEANKPFSIFEAVELAPGLTPSDLEDEKPVQEEIPVQEETSPAPQPIPEPEPEQASAPQPIPEPEPAPEPLADEVAEPVVPSFPEEDEEEESTGYLPQPPRRKSAWGWIIAVGLLAGLAVGLWFGLTVDVSLPDEEPAIEEQEVIAADQEDGDQAELPTQNAVAEQEPPASPAPAVPAPEEPIYETVSPTNYLSSMARRHYGAQIYWVYIYEANSDILGHPDRIAPGTRVVIPPKSSFPPADSEAEARRIAERKAAEINRRFR